MPDCPNSEKRRFRSQAAAKRYERRLQLGPEAERARLYPYECVAGHWHLTHHTPEEQQRIAERIKAATRHKRVSPLRIYCPHGCGTVVQVERPEREPLPQIPDPDQPAPYPTQHERRMFERTGQAVCETLLAHVLFDCPTFAAEMEDCGNTRDGKVCNREARHDGDHELQVDHPSGTETVASWPNLRSVRDA